MCSEEFLLDAWFTITRIEQLEMFFPGRCVYVHVPFRGAVFRYCTEKSEFPGNLFLFSSLITRHLSHVEFMKLAPVPLSLYLPVCIFCEGLDAFYVY